MVIKLDEKAKRRFTDSLVSSGDCTLYKPGNKCRPWVEWAGNRYSPSRVSWYLAYGNWPKEDVRKSCGNTRCVKVEHLFLPSSIKSSSHARSALESAKDKFMSKVQKRGDGCWLWSGTTNNKGYGCVSFLGKTYLAHRASYIMFRGDIPRGMQACHSCDMPSCVNPDHLWVGTNQDNVADMVAKGRLGRRSKLVMRQVEAVRRLARSGVSHPELANALNMTVSSVDEIVGGVRWTLQRESWCSCC